MRRSTDAACPARAGGGAPGLAAAAARPARSRAGVRVRWRAAVRLRVRAGRERGVSTIEVVVLAPLLIAFVMFVVALGLLANAQGKAYGAARDAARAGAIQRDHGSAMAQARRAAEHDFGGGCRRLDVADGGSDYRSGGMFAVTVRCDVPMTGLDLLGIGAVKTVTAHAGAPLDTFRRTG